MLGLAWVAGVSSMVGDLEGGWKGHWGCYCS